MVTRSIVSPPVQYIGGKIHSLRNNAPSFDLSVVHSLNPIRTKRFLLLRKRVIKETKTSFLYWLSSLFLSVKSLMLFPKNGSETCIYLPSDFPRLEPTRSHIPKIPLKHSLSQNGWDTLGSPCSLNVPVQDLVTEHEQFWEAREKHEKEKDSVWLKCPNYFCLRL